GALRRAETARAALEDTLSLLRGAGTRVVHIPLRVGPRQGAVTIFADSATRRWLVACYDMAPNAPGETYQLWFVTATGMRSAGLMPMDHDQPMMMALEMPAGDGPVTGAAMTIEPRAGSVVPSGPLVFQVKL
ncbi:MAG: anti-sigma factor, partial [Gemmatimonadales bacterium]